MNDLDRLDSLDVDALRRRRSAKWGIVSAPVIPAWIAEMDFAVAPPIAQAIDEAIGRGEFGYPLGEQETGLPEACARYQLEGFGWNVEESQVHIVADVLRGIEVSINELVTSDGPVIVTTPCYPPFLELGRACHRELITIPTHGVQGDFDLERIEDACRKGAGAFVLCNPHNPLGRTYTRGDLSQLGEITARYGTRVIADEVHAPITYGTHVPFASVNEANAMNAITITSATKAWNFAGLKCAQIIFTNQTDDRTWLALPTMITQGASTIGIEASVAAYRDGRRWLEDTVSYLSGNRQLIADRLTGPLARISYRVPDATYLAWLDCRALELPVPPHTYFLERANVLLNDGARFGPPGAGFVRMNFATSRAILREILDALAASLA